MKLLLADAPKVPHCSMSPQRWNSRSTKGRSSGPKPNTVTHVSPDWLVDSSGIILLLGCCCAVADNRPAAPVGPGGVLALGASASARITGDDSTAVNSRSVCSRRSHLAPCSSQRMLHIQLLKLRLLHPLCCFCSVHSASNTQGAATLVCEPATARCSTLPHLP
eukprot:GHUV01040438.1.p1 GENE.GHUV01040438.1~~GHUV01040438.1.p1  ORF type:complete len:164 (+),score=34.23 GHUV01040438.1:52-543(+)